MLEATADVAPTAGDPFLVLDSSLSVCAVSDAAERLLATPETDAVNRHVTELLVPADAEAQGPANLAVAVTWAARGDGNPARRRPPGQHLRRPADRADHELRSADGGADRVRLSGRPPVGVRQRAGSPPSCTGPPTVHGTPVAPVADYVAHDLHNSCK